MGNAIIEHKLLISIHFYFIFLTATTSTKTIDDIGHCPTAHHLQNKNDDFVQNEIDRNEGQNKMMESEHASSSDSTDNERTKEDKTDLNYQVKNDTTICGVFQENTRTYKRKSGSFHE